VALDPDAFEKALEAKILERPELAPIFGAAVAASLALAALGVALLWRARRGPRRDLPGPPEPSWGLTAVLAFALAFVPIQLAAFLVARRLFPGEGVFLEVIVPGSIASLLSALLAVALALSSGGDLAGMGLRAARANGPAVLAGLRVFAMAFPLYMGVNLASTKVFQALGWTRAPNAAMDCFLLSPSLFEVASVAVFAVVIAPVTEEVMFRGLIFPALRRRLGFRASAAVTGGIFAVVHPPMDAAAIFVLALALAYAYERTGSLRAPIVAHVANNAWSIGVLAVERYIHHA